VVFRALDVHIFLSNQAQNGLSDDFEQATVNGKFRKQNKERPDEHNTAAEETVGKVHALRDAVIK